MKLLEEFLPLIMPRAKNCPIPLAYQGIRIAAQRFCQATKTWRYTDTYANVPSAAHIVEDTASAPDPAQWMMVELESAFFESEKLEPVSIAWLDQNIQDWRDMDDTDADGRIGKYVTQLEEGSFLVYPPCVGEITLNVIRMPSDAASSVPDYIANNHRNTIAQGALSHILSIPEQPFFNPQLASFHEANFMRILDATMTAGFKGQQRARMRTVGHFF